jgi:hypothetical protein
MFIVRYSSTLSADVIVDVAVAAHAHVNANVHVASSRTWMTHET